MVYTYNRQGLKILGLDTYCEIILSRIRDLIICNVEFIFPNYFLNSNPVYVGRFLFVCLLASLGLRPRIIDGIQV